MLLSLLSACAPTEPAPFAPHSEPLPPGPNVSRSAAGLRLDRRRRARGLTPITRVPDVDGDGAADVLVTVRGERWVEASWAIVTGPILGDRALPDDAATTVRDRSMSTLGDRPTRDGLADLVTHDRRAWTRYESAFRLACRRPGEGGISAAPRESWRGNRQMRVVSPVLGPFAGAVDPETAGLPLPVGGVVADFDGDGRVDLDVWDREPLAEDLWTDWETWGQGEPSVRIPPAVRGLALRLRRRVDWALQPPGSRRGRRRRAVVGRQVRSLRGPALLGHHVRPGPRGDLRSGGFGRRRHRGAGVRLGGGLQMGTASTTSRWATRCSPGPCASSTAGSRAPSC